MARTDLTPREVALIAGVPRRTVEKAIEDEPSILRGRRPATSVSGGRQAGPRRLGPESVVYVALLRNLGLGLPKAGRKGLLSRLKRTPLAGIEGRRIEIAPAVEADVGRLAGPVVERLRWYLQARTDYIAASKDIKGGAPVIKGTRMTVHSVAGRVRHGDTIDEIAAENPDVPREALEAAVIFAEAHPPIGRPGRPWKASPATR